MNKVLQFLLSILMLQTLSGQVVLSADGVTNTYNLINTAFALPNKNVVEVPDCNHASFGDHITQVFDEQLNKFVFQFHILVAYI